jgi:hypothetical protein
MEFIEDYEFYNLEGKQILMEIKQNFKSHELFMMWYNNLKDLKVLPIYEKIQGVMSAYNKYDLYRLYKFKTSIQDREVARYEQLEMNKLIENYKDPDDMNFSNFEVNSLVFRAYFENYRYHKNYVIPRMDTYIKEYIKEYIKNSPL